MSLIADILSGGTTGVVGSILGVAGGFLTSIQNVKQQKLKNEHEIALMKVESEQMKLEHDLGMQTTELNIQGEIAKLDTKTNGDAYIEAIKQLSTPTLSSSALESLLGGNKFQIAIGTVLSLFMGVVDVFRSFVRPGLTIYLVVLTTILTVTIGKVISLQDAFDVTEMISIYKEIVSTIIFLTTMVVGWWFQNRQQSKFSNNLNDGNRSIER